MVITVATLLWIAAADLREYRIRNELVIFLAGLFFPYAFFSGHWVHVHQHLGFAGITFLLMFWCYANALMGGGDLKLMTVAFLWTGTHCAVLYLIVLVGCALLHTFLAWLGWVDAQRVNGRIKIAFAPSIAAGLIGVLISDCLGPHRFESFEELITHFTNN
jgi:prepilin peptidase CpaA